MSRLVAGFVILLAGAAWAAPPAPEPEPKSLGEVARRARVKRQKAAATKSKAEAQTFTNEDLTEVKESNTSNLSLPAGTSGPAAPLPDGSAGDVARAGAQAAASPQLEAAARDLEKARKDLAGVEAEIAEAKNITNPFSTLYSSDPYRQTDANLKVQQLQPQADQLKAQVTQLENRMTEIQKQAEIDSMGSGPLPTEPQEGSALP